MLLHLGLYYIQGRLLHLGLLHTTACVATWYRNLFKSDYKLLILTQNQLSSVVSEGTEAGATVMDEGIYLLANFSLREYADVPGNILIPRESLF